MMARALEERGVALDEREEAFVRNLVQAEAGIHLPPAKRDLVLARVARAARAAGFASPSAYVAHVRAAGSAAHTDLIEALCTHETRFFREPDHFAYLARTIAPRLRAELQQGRRSMVRAWSAGCSTGEEVYSLAMVLLATLGDDLASRVKVLGTDLSRRVLAVAEDATYPLDRAAEIPDGYRKAFMLRGRATRPREMRVAPWVRDVVQLAAVNLVREPLAVAGPFDVIACRNVLIYLHPEARARVAGALLARLAPGGILLLGHAEGLAGARSGARALGPAIYGVGDRERPHPGAT
jgi:chemotaxis protein methyltransferase CheR